MTQKGETLVEVKDLCKNFGVTIALSHVDFVVKTGEIRGLIGENGSGKSTVSSIIAGMQPASSGEMFYKGKLWKPATMLEAQKAGIGMIVQEAGTIANISVAENIFLGNYDKFKKGPIINKVAMISEARKALEKIGVTNINPALPARHYDMQERKLIEIAKCMYNDPELLIVDETTTALSQSGRDIIYRIMHEMADAGKAVMIISHDLNEMMEQCSTLTVLRDGVMVASGSVKDVTTSDLARFMVGHDVRTEKLGTGAQRGEERLSLHGVTQEPYFRNVDLTAYAGEVLGVTGLLGDGRSELFSAVFGAETISAGEIRLCGNPVRITSTWQAKQLGLAYVPRNRKENGIIKDMSILENGTIVSWRELMRHGLLDHARQRAQFEREKAALHIKMGKESDSITSLSGGNQQKVVLAKWLSCKPKVLILDNPTQGVDVGAKEEIYDIILKLAKEGVAVIVLSSEAQEVIRVCDRALVMYHGAIVGEVRGETMTEHEIMRLATGG